MRIFWFFLRLFLAVPILLVISIYFEAEWAFYPCYLALTRLLALDWFSVALQGYNKKPKGDPEHRFHYANSWQLLLYPARITGEQEAAAAMAYKQAGLKRWEGRVAAFFCAFTFPADPLDGFDEDWGSAVSRGLVYKLFLWFIAWDFLIAAFANYEAKYALATVSVVLATIEVVGLTYLFVMDQLRWSRIPPQIRKF